MPRTTRTIAAARLSVLGCALSANTAASDKTTDKANQHTAYYRLNHFFAFKKNEKIHKYFHSAKRRIC